MRTGHIGYAQIQRVKGKGARLSAVFVQSPQLQAAIADAALTELPCQRTAVLIGLVDAAVLPPVIHQVGAAVGPDVQTQEGVLEGQRLSIDRTPDQLQETQVKGNLVRGKHALAAAIGGVDILCRQGERKRVKVDIAGFQVPAKGLLRPLGNGRRKIHGDQPKPGDQPGQHQHQQPEPPVAPGGFTSGGLGHFINSFEVLKRA